MGARQVRQSNKVEYCPLCYKRLTARFAAASHYEAHVRRGELQKSPYGGYYQISETDPTLSGWWHRGFRNSTGLINPPIEKLERERNKHLENRRRLNLRFERNDTQA